MNQLEDHQIEAIKKTNELCTLFINNFMDLLKQLIQEQRDYPAKLCALVNSYITTVNINAIMDMCQIERKEVVDDLVFTINRIMDEELKTKITSSNESVIQE